MTASGIPVAVQAVVVLASLVALVEARIALSVARRALEEADGDGDDRDDDDGGRAARRIPTVDGLLREIARERGIGRGNPARGADDWDWDWDAAEGDEGEDPL